MVTFQGRTPVELRRAFRESVDDYLEFCADVGKSPDKPFSGKFITRLDPSLHKRISTLAEVAGKSLNQFVSDCLETAVNGLASSARAKPSRQRGEPSAKRAG